jgi:hypothetical protein
MLITQVMLQAPCSLSRWNVHNDSVLPQLHRIQWFDFSTWNVSGELLMVLTCMYCSVFRVCHFMCGQLSCKFCIEWFIFTIKPHLESYFRDFSTCLITETSIFITNTARVCPSHNYSINTGLTLIYFAVFTFSGSTVHLQTEYFVLCVNLTKNWKVLKW